MAEKITEIYLDMNATTKVLHQAARAAQEAMEISFGNPSSSHITGLKAKHLMENARRLARQVIGASDGELVFNSGATEGIQTAILSALDAARLKTLPKKPILMYGATEHKAVHEGLKHWNKILNIGAELLPIPVDKRGLLDLEFIGKHVGDALMICTMNVNNETGVVQDIPAIEKVIRQHNSDVLWLVDGVQGLGKIEINLAETSIDYATFSGHKIYALKGIGLLYVRKGAAYTPIITGGGQEGGLRSGTENLPGMAALQTVFSLLLDSEDSTFKNTEVLSSYRLRLSKAIQQAFPQVVFNNDFSCSVPTTINFSVPGISSKEMMDLFDAASIRVSSGSACSSKVTRSYVLDAMGLETWRSESAIRLSFGPAMSEDLLERACQRIVTTGEALRQNCMILSDQIDDSETFGINGLLQLKNGNSCTWLYNDETSGHCVVIDPLPELAGRIENMVRCQKLKLQAVLDTHGHADHISCRSDIQHLLTEYIPSTQYSTDSLGWPQSTTQECVLADGVTRPVLQLGSQVLVKVSQPGHTADSVGFLLGVAEEGHLPANNVQYAFLGDTILMDSLGRSDFATSNALAMYDSLKHISNLISETTIICPAHDYNNQFVTTLATECVHNEMLNKVLKGEIDKEEFKEEKSKWDKNLIDTKGSEILCGVNTHTNSNNIVGDEINADQLRAWLADNKKVSLVDIREPHEHELHHQEQFGDSDVINIPLTRLAQFVAGLLKEPDARPVVFICRSGSRSKLASEALRRMGLNQVTHVAGGYALS